MTIHIDHKENMLLVTCCAPCAPYIIDQLKEKFALTVYFYNPNIQPEEEYEMRKLEIEGYAASLELPFVEGDYDVERWMSMTEELHHEPEGGLRCDICFSMRINRACQYAVENGFKLFATTFALSPYKNKNLVYKICKNYARDYGLKFLDYDFRKKDGFKASMQMSKKMDFYMQHYCGCIYSLQEAEDRRTKRHALETITGISGHIPI
ncbi:MAG: epoxyqueuosine reductase QueH [Candidatus Omnitrophica bacterium]|nr:epoxyqueuosine reductase QueH [Candidatus Omnitrophota bacterium]